MATWVKYKDHQVKPALEMNQSILRLPIVYIHGRFAGSDWYGAWCRMPDEVRKRTHRFNPAEARGAVNFITNNTVNGQVRAAVNGGFFTPITTDPNEPVYIMGEVGTGNQGYGNWERDQRGNVRIRYPRQRWCFGMYETGRAFGILQMQPVEHPEGEHYEVNRLIEEFYPFGLSRVGNLSVTDTTWPFYNDPRKRAALAWGWNHFFLIVAKSWTWGDTYRFFFEYVVERDEQGRETGRSLQAYIESRHRERVKIADAVMLDGGGSTQFNYRRIRRDGRVAESEPHDLSDGRRITTMVHVWAIWDR